MSWLWSGHEECAHARETSCRLVVGVLCSKEERVGELPVQQGLLVGVPCERSMKKKFTDPEVVRKREFDLRHCTEPDRLVTKDGSSLRSAQGAAGDELAGHLG